MKICQLCRKKRLNEGRTDVVSEAQLAEGGGIGKVWGIKQVSSIYYYVQYNAQVRVSSGQSNFPDEDRKKQSNLYQVYNASYCVYYL